MKKAKRVSKQEWFAAALTALETGGTQTARVERFTRAFGVAKSGCYQHLENRIDLLVHLLSFWETEYTEIVASDPRAAKGTPEQRLIRVMRMVEISDLAVYDLAFRVWARKDGLAREAL